MSPKDITKLKSDIRMLKSYIEKNKNNVSKILVLLKKLGKLDKNFEGEVFKDLVFHDNSEVRLWAVKNIGKIQNKKYIQLLKKIAIEDMDTDVRKEAVAAIGRLRDRGAIDILMEFLNDEDPEVVSQAIRGLLVFKGDNLIDSVLKKFIEHENEIIRDIIYVEYFSKNEKKEILHKESPIYLRNVAVKGDALEIMKLLPSESIHLTFTSPPYYNAKNYSKYKSYEGYLKFLFDIFKEVYRITKEGRFLVLNVSPVIIPRVGRKYKSKRYAIPFDIHPYLEEIGWEFVDDILWVKPEGSAKNRIGGFLQHRKPLTYKPNPIVEYLLVYRKKTPKLIDWNIKQYDEDIVNESRVLGNIDKTNVWYINPANDYIHEAVFPEEICEKVIKYYSFKKDLVFDPFAGRGTVGKVALKLNRYFFLIERNPTYFEYLKEYIKNKQQENINSKFLDYKNFRRYLNESRKGSS